MSKKHGVYAALTLIMATALLGAVGLQPFPRTASARVAENAPPAAGLTKLEAWAAQARTLPAEAAHELAGSPGVPEMLAAERGTLDTPELLLASAASPFRLAELLVGSATVAQLPECDEIFLDIHGTPERGPAPLNVLFEVESRRLVNGNPGPNEPFHQVQVWFEGYPGPSQVFSPTIGPWPPMHEYEEPGFYDVAFRVFYMNQQDGRVYPCPPQDTDPVIKPAYIEVTDEDPEEDEEDPNPASFDAVSLIEDGEALVPNNDWAPLFMFSMSFPDGAPAPRTLTHLSYHLVIDQNPDQPRDHFTLGLPPQVHNFLEFGLFRNFGPDGEPDDEFNLQHDIPFLTWDAHGFPYHMSGTSLTSPSYNLNFTFDPNHPTFNPAQPFTDSPERQKFPFSEWVTAGAEPNNSFIVAARLSSTWQHGQTMSVIVDMARMQPYQANPAYHQGIEVLPFPVNDEGEKIDNYDPDFYEGEVLAEETAYVSGFAVWDVRGDDIPVSSPWDNRINAWNYKERLYSPATEFRRPRWDISDTFIQQIAGEWMDVRELLPIENWTALLGIHVHGQDYRFGGGGAQPRQINVVLTDVGGDPFLPPGSGGFDPRTGLQHFTTSISHPNANIAADNDFAFNGVWLFHDTNGNGVFDPPTPTGTQGVSFTDFPMYPGQTPGSDFVDPGILEWEYVPFPPGGGDPWWKLRFELDGGRRRNAGDTPDGTMGGSPQPYNTTTRSPRPNYFLVVRPDSGFTDISGLPGDGTGIRMGAEWRAFIEPRRWNPGVTRPENGAPPNYVPPGAPTDRGYWDGGILLSNQTMADGLVPNWQDDPRADYVCSEEEYPCPPLFPDEPFAPLAWWPERTHNQDVVKPVRTGIEVHDLVLAYSTTNVYAKETFIMEGQSAGIAQRAVGFPVTGNPIVNPTGFTIPTVFSLWIDPPLLPITGIYELEPRPLSNDWSGIGWLIGAPGFGPPGAPGFGMNALRSAMFNQPGVISDKTDRVGFRPSRMTAVHYAYETVPFRLDGDVIDGQLNVPRSQYFPNAHQQPTLPRINTWPAFEEGAALTNAGNSSYVFLASMGTPHEDYHAPPSPGSESTYQDDVYVYVVEEPQFGIIGDVAGQWLVDDLGHRFRILSNVGNRLTLDRGHGAYVGRFHTNGDPVYIPRHPFGVQQGEEWAIQRSRWAIVQDTLRRGTTPRMEDWPVGLAREEDFSGQPQRPNIDGPEGVRAARLLRQYVEARSEPTAMLGVNLVGTDDPAVNQFPGIALNSITVAFWGPEFTPTDLSRLDEDGRLSTSGVLLYQDTNHNGVFDPPVLFDFSPTPVFVDQVVPLTARSLQWRPAPEPVNLYGDVDQNGNFVADDLSGDGIVYLGGTGPVDSHQVRILGRHPADDVVKTVGQMTAEERAQWDGLDDRAWVLRLQPDGRWPIPQSDARVGGPSGPGDGGAGGGGGGDGGGDDGGGGGGGGGGNGDDDDTLLVAGTGKTALDQWPSFWTKEPTLVDLFATTLAKQARAKALPPGGSPGDDLYVVVRTSSTISALQEFRVVVPSRLPTRTPASQRVAGIQMSPLSYPVIQSFEKAHPDEGVADFYGHDMLKASVPTRIVNLTNQAPGGNLTIEPGGPPVALLGIESSANRPDDLVDRGVDGVRLGHDTYQTTGRTWTAADDIVGHWMVGLAQPENSAARVETYEITGFSGQTLTLRVGDPNHDPVGAPGNGPWRVVRNPHFLEQVIVEFYDLGPIDQSTGRMVPSGNFDLQTDLLPLNFEDPANPQREGEDGPITNSMVSGVSIYRDNPWHPLNTPGVFDPPFINEQGELEYIDLPVTLDQPPVLIGLPNEPQFQVKFVFSSPGTDNWAEGRIAMPYENQPRLRQIINQTFGQSPADEEFGPDFFVVVRPSRSMNLGDDFSAAIVSWGPNTPSEVDPDNFRPDIHQPGGQPSNAFDVFSEFPFGARGIGYISMFRDRPDVRYWGYDKDRRRVVPRWELDHSQDDRFSTGDGGSIPYWIRTNPNVEGRTGAIVGGEPPELDFVGAPRRAAPGTEIQFTLLSTAPLRRVEWIFGDGSNFVTEDPAEFNPVHVYTEEGLYTVSLIATDLSNVTETVVKPEYIEIIATPFVDFSATPTDGVISTAAPCSNPPGLNVQFTDLSQPGEGCEATSWLWLFGDGQSSTEQNPSHCYNTPGVYSVTLEVTFTCEDGTTVTRSFTQSDFIVVRPSDTGEGEEGEGEPEEIDTASFNVEDQIRDQEALMPLTNWVPLFRFTMGFGEEDFAPRVLESLTYRIVPDGREPEALNYLNFGAPASSDLLEFGLFQETFADDDNDGVLDSDNDFLLHRWNNQGAPVGQLVSEVPFQGLTYQLDFIGNGTPESPQFPVTAAPELNALNGNSYIVAVRTSATWRSGLTMGVEVLNARMVMPTGTFPTDDEGAPADSYSPDFADGDILEEENAYSSSFSAWDITGKPADTTQMAESWNAWNHPVFTYTPLAEFTRPRWNQPARLLDAFAGEILNVRTLASTEDWLGVVGFNIHSTKAVHFDGRLISNKDNAQLREVSVILTDVGADPNGPPGNGGFDPRTGLNQMTGLGVLREDEAGAIGDDYAFNGVWVWHDSNGNGTFNPPTMNPGGGISFDGDLPMRPDIFAYSGWEYVPFPPDGGDPWWKTTLRFWDGAHRELLGEDNTTGFVDPTPNNFYDRFGGSDVSFEYFLVVRPDSGYQDVSLRPGDGQGIQQGAEFRALVEPRRFNSTTGNFDGGVYVDSMVPTQFQPWQNDPRWGADEPWWPERTMNVESAKPVRVGLEVYDLAMTYHSDSVYRRESAIFFGGGSFSDSLCFAFALDAGFPTDFDLWTDPFGLRQNRFLNRHSVGVSRSRWQINQTIDLVPTEGDSPAGNSMILLYDDFGTSGHYAYETVPFFSPSALLGDAPPQGPRSAAFPVPPAQPTLPTYATWPRERRPGEYQRASDWAPEDNRARLLTQKIDVNSTHTALLGFNVAGSVDPIVNSREASSIASITVAFWGPDFHPDDLRPLDSAGRDLNSGVLLWEDTNQDGTFLSTELLNTYANVPLPVEQFDSIVPLRDLRWRAQPELIDLTGDGVPNDLNGDGVVDENDRAWVLEISPQTQWPIPYRDGPRQDLTPSITLVFCATIDFSKELERSVKDLDRNFVELRPKQLDVTEIQPGMDLFLTVRTSDNARRFSQFRAVVPATLPERPTAQRQAGVQFFPQVDTAPGAFAKRSPEEDPVQDFYGHDVLEVNVPVRVVDLASQNQTVTIGGGPRAVLGLDISTNRPDATLATGNSGVPAPGSFTVAGANWTEDAFVGDWLIDQSFEAFEITANSATELTLLSGEPQTGPWRIVRDPTFLEQVVVELYNEGAAARFNAVRDLLPLNIDQEVSGVALYRDNIHHPDNRVGMFDPGIDIPIRLDARPQFVGEGADDVQVRFVFSTPGTDDVPVPREQQNRNRQWVPDTFGTGANPFAGPDFFVVVRADAQMNPNTTFRAGIVSWGPNTPTEPDPDTWAGLTGGPRNDFRKFQEFPWGSRGLGFITFFKEPQVRYFMDGTRAGQKVDNSGFNWVRTHGAIKRRSGAIRGTEQVDGVFAVRIESASETVLPAQTMEQPFRVIVRGSGFGTSPQVALSGYQTTVVSANNENITLDLRTREDYPPEEPIVIIVRNPETGVEASRSDLFRLGTGTVDGAPEITSVSPSRGDRSAFPITVNGMNFPSGEALQVLFGTTLMPIESVTPDGTRIVVGYPLGGLARTGRMDVTVRNTANNRQDILVDGFEFLSAPDRAKLFGCAPGTGSLPAGGWGDGLLAGLVALLLGAGVWRRGRNGSSGRMI